MTLVVFVDRRQFQDKKGGVPEEKFDKKRPVAAAFAADGRRLDPENWGGEPAKLLLIDDHLQDHPLQGAEGWHPPTVEAPIIVVYHRNDPERSRWLGQVGLGTNLTAGNHITHEKWDPLFSQLARLLVANPAEAGQFVSKLCAQHENKHFLQLIDEIGAQQWYRDLATDPIEKRKTTHAIASAFEKLPTEIQKMIDPGQDRNYTLDDLNRVAAELVRGTTGSI